MASRQGSLQTISVLLLVLGLLGPCALAGRVSSRVTQSSSVRTQVTGGTLQQHLTAAELTAIQHRKVQAHYQAAQHLGHARPRDEQRADIADKRHTFITAGLQYTLQNSLATYAEAVAACLGRGASLGGSMWPPDQEAMAALCHAEEDGSELWEGCWLLSPATQTGPNSLCRAWKPEATLVDVPCSTRRHFVCVTADPAAGITSEDYDYYRVDYDQQQADTAAVSSAAPGVAEQQPAGARISADGNGFLMEYKVGAFHYALQSPAGYADAALFCSMQGMWLAGSRWPEDIAALDSLCMNTLYSPDGCWLEPQPDTPDNQCSYTMTDARIEVCECDKPRSFICARHRTDGKDGPSAADSYEDYYISSDYQQPNTVQRFVDWGPDDNLEGEQVSQSDSHAGKGTGEDEEDDYYGSWSTVIDYWEDDYIEHTHGTSKVAPAAVTSADGTSRMAGRMEVYEIANLVYAKLPHRVPYAEARRACGATEMQPIGSQEMYDQVAFHMLCTEEKNAPEGCWRMATSAEEGEQVTCLAQKGVDDAVEVDCAQPHGVLCVATTPYFYDWDSQYDYERKSYTDGADTDAEVAPVLTDGAAATTTDLGMTTAADIWDETDTETAAGTLQAQPLSQAEQPSSLSEDRAGHDSKGDDMDWLYSQDYHYLETETGEHADSMVDYVGNVLASAGVSQIRPKGSVLVPGRAAGSDALIARLRGAAAAALAARKAEKLPSDNQEVHAEHVEQPQQDEGQAASVLVVAQVHAADNSEAHSTHAPSMHTAALLVLQQARPEHGLSALQLLGTAAELVQSGKQVVSGLLSTAKEALLREIAIVPVLHTRRALQSRSRQLLSEDSLSELSMEASAELSLSDTMTQPNPSPSPDQPSPSPSPDQPSPFTSPDQPSPDPPSPVPSPDPPSPSPEDSLAMSHDTLPPDSPPPSPQDTPTDPPSPPPEQPSPAPTLAAQSGQQVNSADSSSMQDASSQSGDTIVAPGANKDSGRVMPGWVPALGAIAGLMLVAMLGAAVYVYAKRGGGGYRSYAEVELMGDYGNNGSDAPIQSARTTYTMF